MSTLEPTPGLGNDATNNDMPERVLTPQAQRALQEAAERRAARDAIETERAKEIGGRKGLDPVRYGDWEQGGIAWDF